MKTFKILAAALLLAALPMLATAQPGNGWCAMNNNYNRLYNANTVIQLTGTIEKIDRVTPEQGMSVGIHLMVKTSTETMSVHLGPAWYLDNQDIQFVVGDKIMVSGSKITYQNAPAIIAMKVTRGEQELWLRDKNGAPKWNAWQKGAGKGKGKGGKRGKVNG